ncbi:MAG: hypothetical protein ACI8QD_000646 [Cyclobacteriaceae bacterium]|jgi:hypothetical protein
MAILGSLLKKGISLTESIEQQFTSPGELQKNELRKLLITARNTQFGNYFKFTELLKAFKSPDTSSYYKSFRECIPIFDYNRIHQEWWSKSLEGTGDVCWPGKIKYYALSSGTSGSPSKHIPVSKEMITSIRRTSIRQMMTIHRYEIPDSLLTKGILMLGGSTDLKRNGDYFEGDLSGITTSQIPFWFQHYYKPGKRISRNPWDSKLEEITKNAHKWDIGIIAGVPAWLQLLMEKIVAHYQVKSIHDVWPNLKVFVHGGVPFQPYRKGFERLCSQPLIYMETYLASEGFIAFQSYPDQKGMTLVLNNGIYYEFIPFNEENFDADGELLDSPTTLTINEVAEGRPYALLISTNAGAWRYLIGDVITFTSLQDVEISISGRTKLFLSLCGEHLSLDNMSQAIALTEEQLNIAIKEFTVLGKVKYPHFGHQWYIGCDDEVDENELSLVLDHHLCKLNDDYKVERQHVLKDINVQVLSTYVFDQYMHERGKVGAQVKFPRVLKGDKVIDWENFLSTKDLSQQVPEA